MFRRVSRSLSSQQLPPSLELRLDFSPLNVKAMIETTRAAIRADREAGFEHRLPVFELDSKGAGHVSAAALTDSARARAAEVATTRASDSSSVQQSFGESFKKPKSLYQMLSVANTDGNWQYAIKLFEGAHAGITATQVVRSIGDQPDPPLPQKSSETAEALSSGSRSVAAEPPAVSSDLVPQGGYRFRVEGSSSGQNHWQWHHVRCLSETLLTVGRIREWVALLAVLRHRQFFKAAILENRQLLDDALMRFIHWGVRPLKDVAGHLHSKDKIDEIRRVCKSMVDQLQQLAAELNFTVEYRTNHLQMWHRLNGLEAERRRKLAKKRAAVIVSSQAGSVEAVESKRSQEQPVAAADAPRADGPRAGSMKPLNSIAAQPHEKTVFTPRNTAGRMRSILGSSRDDVAKCASVLAAYREHVAALDPAGGQLLDQEVALLTMRALMRHIPASPGHSQCFSALLMYCRGGPAGALPPVLDPQHSEAAPRWTLQPLRRWHIAPTAELYSVAIAFFHRVGDLQKCWELFMELKQAQITGTAPIYRTMLKVAVVDPGPHDTPRGAVVALDLAMSQEGVSLSSPQDMLEMIKIMSAVKKGKRQV
jgi:hypothetical protein